MVQRTEKEAMKAVSVLDLKLYNLCVSWHQAEPKEKNSFINDSHHL